MKTETRTIDMPEETFRVAVVADTHSTPHKNARNYLEARKPDLILHAGDIGDLDVLDGLAEMTELIAIRGNIDEHAPHLPDELNLEFMHRGALMIRVMLTHIGVYGPKLRAPVRKRALAKNAQIVVCGHSHVPLIARDGKVVIFNPGSIGPRRFQLPITFGMLTIAGGRVNMEHVDCETGQKWLPPSMELSPRPR